MVTFSEEYVSPDFSRQSIVENNSRDTEGAISLLVQAPNSVFDTKVAKKDPRNVFTVSESGDVLVSESG